MMRIGLRLLFMRGAALGLCVAAHAAHAAEAAERGGSPPKIPRAAPERAVLEGRHGAAIRAERTTAPASAQNGDSFAVLKTGSEHSRLVYRGNLPVSDLEATIKQLFRMEEETQANRSLTKPGISPSFPRVAIASSPVSNSLVVGGPPDAVEEVRKLLEQLDKPSMPILLEVEIGETSPAGLKQSEAAPPAVKPSAPADPLRLFRRPANMETVGRVRLTTMDNQPAFVQMGSRVPVVQGVAKSGSGEVRSASMTNVGLIVGITPRVTPDKSVVMEINAEQSRLGPEEEGTPVSIAAGKVIRMPRIETTTVQSTVTIADAQSVILGSVAQQGRSGGKALVIVVTPHVLSPGEAPRPR